MKVTFLVVLSVLAAGSSGSYHYRPPHASYPPTTLQPSPCLFDLKADVIQFANEFKRLLNSKNMKGMLELFTDDVALLISGRDVAFGKKAVVAFFQPLFDQNILEVFNRIEEVGGTEKERWGRGILIRRFPSGEERTFKLFAVFKNVGGKLKLKLTVTSRNVDSTK